MCSVTSVGPPSPPSLHGRRKTSPQVPRGLCCILPWPAKACNPSLTCCCSGGSWGELRSDRKNVSCAVHELREYYLIVGLMENIMWGWCSSFQGSASNRRSGALLETAGEAGVQPPSALHAPELPRLADRAQLGLCQGAWQLGLGLHGGSSQFQALTQNPRGSRPWVLLTGVGVNLSLSPCRSS